MVEEREMISALKRISPGYIRDARVKRKYERRKPLSYHIPKTAQKRPSLPIAKRHAMLLMFFRDLRNPDVTDSLMTVREIADRTNCCQLTVKNLINKYLKNNGDVRDGRTYGHGLTIPVEVRTFIL